VTLSPFYISVCEITRLQFEKVLIDPSDKNMPGRRQEPNEDPVQMVPWFQAVEFCNRMSDYEHVAPYYVLNNPREEEGNRIYDVVIPDSKGYGFRLPTEAEWEYACRAGSAGLFCFGNNTQQLDDYAWHFGNSWEKKTNKVKMKEPNAFGLYDMHGNVSEWCHDWYEPNYSTTQPVTDPLGPSAGQIRVIRGGNYMWGWEDCRSAARFPARSHAPWFFHRSVGFRVARYLPPEKSGDAGFAGAK
jgi:formylglycine-generating enzyme required for sulfatase activity